MNVQHTPGPWVCRGSGVEAQAFDGSWKWLMPSVHGGSREQATANARLIAQAPHLYALVKDALQYLEETLGPCEPDCDCLIHSFRTVIAKIEGVA